MEWIKKNTDQFALAVLGFVLLASSVFIILKALNFTANFSALESTPPRNDKVPPVDLAVMTEAQQSAAKPATWNPKPPAGAKAAGSLFVADKHVLQDGKLVEVNEEGMFFRPVPNGWLKKYGLSLLDPKVLTDDPDQDGFSNVDEYLGASRAAESQNPEGDPDSTNPTDKEAHPPYISKLFLKQWVRERFRLLFNAYDGDPKDPKSMTFQINTLDLRQPTEFLKLGQLVPNTKYKLEKFEYKVVENPATGAETDVSELTLRNTGSNEAVVLVKEKVTNSPDDYGIFSYRWPQPPQDIRINRLQEFALRPNVNEKYKLVDIKETEAVIALPTGDKYTVPRAQ